MKRSSELSFFAVIACILLAAIFIGGCGHKNNVAMGPMPSKSDMPDKDGRQMAGDMRAWIQDMKPSDAETLEKTGHLVISWENLKVSDPNRAKRIDDFIEQRRIATLDAFSKDKGEPTPTAKRGLARLATHQNPETIDFERKSPGEYWVVIGSTKGIGAYYLQISK